jgi:hypothetical protein
LMAPAGGAAVAQDGADGAVLWKTPVNENPAALKGDEGLPAAFSPDGRTVAVAIGKRVEIRGALDGTLIKQLADHPLPTYGVTWSPDGKLLAVTMIGESDSYEFWGDVTDIPSEWRDQSAVYLWQVGDGKLRAKCVGHRMHVVGAEFSPDGRRLLTFGKDNSMRLWDTADGTEVAAFETDVTGHRKNRGPARLGGFTRKPAYLVTSEDGAIHIRHPSTGWRITKISAFSMATCAPLAVADDGRIAFCSRDLYADFAALVNRTSSASKAKKQEGEPAKPADDSRQALVEVPGDQLMIARLRDGTSGYLEIEAGDSQFALRGLPGKIVDDASYYRSVGFSTDGKWAVTVRFEKNNEVVYAVWNAITWTPKRIDRPPGNPRYFSTEPPIFTPDSRYLVAEHAFCELATGRWKSPTPNIPTTAQYSFSADGGRLLTIDEDAVATYAAVRDFRAVEKTFVPVEGP